ncbi:hypothetical protein [Schinkia azotoformans]|uniref:hypothetical protein n=1 Tax=Schinkia azotoformans TaxID=1454 RepID=UPI002DBF4691|nr:hypothetical protein [Schinkia azotoformans]MEC1717193.1 hypothetical protein [Schinkia azotoformans]MEC1742007.1 hypothetical protein [Schinkia azotoformans]MEC1758248.1 hypothetical protein [Schinkia azotoformans]MEC1766351.1 hypothetical protein [Schinkia azotoformans]MEC1786470.1 hypothetical protein [Schinkia azotoformans]
MRRKRSARKKKMRKKALYQTASLISIAAFGIAQVTPSSHAVFSHSVTIEDRGITTSFVFPETIEGLVNEIKVEVEKVATARELADSVYGKLEQAESSEQANSENNLGEIFETAKASEKTAIDKMNQLNIYLVQGKMEVIDDESAINILNVIEEGTQAATELLDSIVIMVKEIEEMKNQVNVMITAMAQAEAAALEKEMIAEIAQKALEGLMNANTGAADLLTKLGPDFDLNAFQAFTKELVKSQADLQKALEDAENYVNELKAYIDGTKEVASPEVLKEAKANYEKVQQAIDSLKETMENTKTTNTEVQAKIEQEKQRQEEEAQKIEQERIKQEEEAKKTQQELESQSAPVAGGGSSNPETPPAEQVPNPEVPTTGEGGGGAPNPDQPPVADEEQNPSTPPEDGEQQNPDQPPVAGEEPPVTPPSNEEGQDQNDQSDGGIENQPARPNDEDSQSGNEDDINPDPSANDNEQPEAEQPPNSNQNNPTDKDGQDVSSNDTEETKETATAEATPNGDETQSTDQSTSDSESIERDTVASLNAIKVEQDFYSFESLILNRRDEENDLFDGTAEIFSHDVQKDIITMDNNHKVKINIRTYLPSKWNKRL